MIKCSECGRIVLDKADACPNCGDPFDPLRTVRSKPMKRICLFVMIILSVLLMACKNAESSDTDPQITDVAVEEENESYFDEDPNLLTPAGVCEDVSFKEKKNGVYYFVSKTGEGIRSKIREYILYLMKQDGYTFETVPEEESLILTNHAHYVMKDGVFLATVFLGDLEGEQCICWSWSRISKNKEDVFFDEVHLLTPESVCENVVMKSNNDGTYIYFLSSDLVESMDQTLQYKDYLSSEGYSFREEKYSDLSNAFWLSKDNLDRGIFGYGVIDGEHCLYISWLN